MMRENRKMQHRTLTGILAAAVLMAFLTVFSAVTVLAAGDTYKVQVSSGYLALRNAMAYDQSNEIGSLYTGETVTTIDTSNDTYWYVHSTKLNKDGYVNKNYLVAVPTAATPETQSVTVPAFTVSVSSGYLALRDGADYNTSSEIGQLQAGEKLLVSDSTSTAAYWMVYAPSLGKLGYVNRNYLTSGTTLTVAATPYTARVTSGYLALRTAKAYDSSNEIGKIYTDETVQVLSAGSNTQYWYVYAPTLGKFGYVNKDYLVSTGSTATYTTKTVKVESGYLALRTAKAYDSANEIGKLYTGETVQVTEESSTEQYWYVYAPSLDKYGYVNKDYLY